MLDASGPLTLGRVSLSQSHSGQAAPTSPDTHPLPPLATLSMWTTDTSTGWKKRPQGSWLPWPTGYRAEANTEASEVTTQQELPAPLHSARTPSASRLHGPSPHRIRCQTQLNHRHFLARGIGEARASGHPGTRPQGSEHSLVCLVHGSVSPPAWKVPPAPSIQWKIGRASCRERV